MEEDNHKIYFGLIEIHEGKDTFSATESRLMCVCNYRPIAVGSVPSTYRIILLKRNLQHYHYHYLICNDHASSGTPRRSESHPHASETKPIAIWVFTKILIHVINRASVDL